MITQPVTTILDPDPPLEIARAARDKLIPSLRTHLRSAIADSDEFEPDEVDELIDTLSCYPSSGWYTDWLRELDWMETGARAITPQQRQNIKLARAELLLHRDNCKRVGRIERRIYRELVS